MRNWKRAVHFLATISTKMPDSSRELSGSFEHPMTPVASMEPVTPVVLKNDNRDTFTRVTPNGVEYHS